jgi:hypothetical protein
MIKATVHDDGPERDVEASPAFTDDPFVLVLPGRDAVGSESTPPDESTTIALDMHLHRDVGSGWREATDRRDEP